MKKYAEVLYMIKRAYPQQVASVEGPAWRKNIGNIDIDTGTPAAPKVPRQGLINGKPVSQIYPKQSKIYTSPPPAVSGSTPSAAAQPQQMRPVRRLSPELQAYADATYKPARAAGSGSNMTTISDLFARPRDNVFSSQQEKRQYFNNDPQRITQYNRRLEDAAATRRELARGQLQLAGRDAINNVGQAMTNVVQRGVGAIRSVTGTNTGYSGATPSHSQGQQRASLRGRIYNRPNKHYLGRSWKGN